MSFPPAAALKREGSCESQASNVPRRTEVARRTAVLLSADSALCYDQNSCGGVAQLGERLVRNEEVDGSNPFTSTTCRQYQVVLNTLLSVYLPYWQCGRSHNGETDNYPFRLRRAAW